MAAVGVLEAFLSTWSKARATFGAGTPEPGSSYDDSATLTGLRGDLDAAPTAHWSGRAAEAYGAANADHRRVVSELGTLDRRLADQIDRSAQIVTAGRRDLEAIREWVIAAAASVPRNRAGELMVAPIVQQGLAQLAEVVARANADLSTVGGDIATIDREFQALGFGKEFGGLPEAPRPIEKPESERTKNQVDAFREVVGRDPVSDSDWLTASALDPHSYDPKTQGGDANIVATLLHGYGRLMR